VTGFKPTARRVDRTGVYPLSKSQDSIGPLAWSVDCCAITDAIVSGESLDTTAAPLAGLRLGVSDDVVGTELDPEVARAFDAALQTLAAGGAVIQHFAFPELRELPRILSGGGLQSAEAWAWHRTMLETSADQYDPRVSIRILRGKQQTAADYVDVLNARRWFIGEAKKRLAPFDAWVMPTLALVAPLLAPLEASDEAYFEANTRTLRNTGVINFMDGCALTIPCPVGKGLPVGFSVCGQHRQDARVLQIGRAVEAAIRGSAPS
jgi:aspartyl-tRNA(Asn)/glutamyl-tRNA(Gln) amidotransferase subunit A